MNNTYFKCPVLGLKGFGIDKQSVYVLRKKPFYSSQFYLSVPNYEFEFDLSLCPMYDKLANLQLVIKI